MAIVARRNMLSLQEVSAFNANFCNPESLEPGEIVSVGHDHNVKRAHKGDPRKSTVVNDTDEQLLKGMLRKAAEWYITEHSDDLMSFVPDLPAQELRDSEAEGSNSDSIQSSRISQPKSSDHSSSSSNDDEAERQVVHDTVSASDWTRLPQESGLSVDCMMLLGPMLQCPAQDSLLMQAEHSPASL